MSYGTLMQFAREHFDPAQLARHGSIVKALLRRWPESDVDAMLRGAALLGWTDLRAINGKEGVGRRWAMAAYWHAVNRREVRLPQPVKDILREASR